MEEASRADLRRCVRARLRQRVGHLCAGLRVEATRRQPVAATLRRILPVSDPRIERTIAAVESRLLRDGFVMRYSTEEVEDALPPGEGAFLACSFWLVDVYTLQGRLGDAERLFRRLVGLRNDLGLLSEEYDSGTKRLVGNFPQAFSHLALVNSAYNLTRTRKPVHHRAQDEHALPEEVTAAAD